MITARDLQPLVENETFRRLLKLSEADPASRAHRVLKGLDRLARETSKQEERDARRRTSKAPGHAPRRSLKETTGDEQHVPV